MGYDNRFTGEITITPPLTWSEIESGPKLLDVQLRVTEARRAAEDRDFEIVCRTADAIIPHEGGYSGHRVLDDLAAVVAHYEGHEFAGHIQVQWDSDFGDPIPTRYAVRGRDVVEVRATLVWPDEADA